MKIAFALSLLCLFTTNISFAEIEGKTSPLANQALVDATADGQDRGGGNAYEAEFKSIGRMLLQQMQQKELTQEQLGFSLVAFEIALNEVTPVGTDRNDLELPNGLDRPFLNSPKGKAIVFRNAVWAGQDDNQKNLTVMHEYLRFCNVDDSGYAFSLRALEFLSGTPPNPAKVGHIYRVVKTESWNILFFMNGIDVYLEGISAPTSMACGQTGSSGHSQDLLYIDFASSENSKSHYEGVVPNCDALVAYLSTANTGAEVYVRVSMNGFSFY